MADAAIAAKVIGLVVLLDSDGLSTPEMPELLSLKYTKIQDRNVFFERLQECKC